MFGKIVLVFAIFAVTSTSWIEAAPTDDEDSLNLDPVNTNQLSECGINEYWDLNGSDLQPTCQQPDPIDMTRMYVPRCTCKEGYIRRTDGSECIEIINCPPINEITAEDKKDYDDSHDEEKKKYDAFVLSLFKDCTTMKS